MPASTDTPIAFPHYRPVPQAILLLAAVLGIGAMAVFPFSVWAGAACFIVALGCYLSWFRADRHNRKAREAWLRNSHKTICFKDAAALVKESPGQFVLHVKTTTGLDSTFAAAAISNPNTGETL